MSTSRAFRSVTADEHSAHFWLGRLSAALAVAPHHPQVARETLDAYVRSPVVDPEELRIIQTLRKGTPK